MGVAQPPLLPQLLVAGFASRLHSASAHVHPPPLTAGSHTEEDGKQANNIRVNAASWDQSHQFQRLAMENVLVTKGWLLVEKLFLTPCCWQC